MMTTRHDQPGTRRAVLASAALAVLGGVGPGGFTHRTVDAHAGLPSGSVNYYAPSRSRLLHLALEALVESDMDTAVRWFTADPDHRPLTTSDLVDRMTGFVEEMASPAARTRVVARHHLLGEALHDPDLRAAFDAVRDDFIAFATDFVRVVEPTAGPSEVEAAVNVVDSLINRQVVIGRDQLDTTAVRAIITLLLPSAL